MDRSDVRRILGQHDIQLSDAELETVLLRLTKRSQVVSATTTINQPEVTQNISQRRPLTGSIERPRVPLLKTYEAQWKPRTAPSQLSPNTTSNPSRFQIPAAGLSSEQQQQQQYQQQLLLQESQHFQESQESQQSQQSQQTQQQSQQQTQQQSQQQTQQTQMLAEQTYEERRAITDAPNMETISSIQNTNPATTTNITATKNYTNTTNSAINNNRRKQISMIAQIAVNDREELFNIKKTGDVGTIQRAPWQSQKKQYRKNPNAVVVGGLDAVFRMTNQNVINIDNIRSGNNEYAKVLPPDIIIDPTTQRTIALAHQRRVLYEGSDITPVATRESFPVESPRIIEMDARRADPLSGKKAFRQEDACRHASGGWATDLDYRDLHQAPWTTTTQDPLLSYCSPINHRLGKRELHPDWDGATQGRVVLPIGKPERPKGIKISNQSVVNSPRLKYQRRMKEMDKAVKGWESCQTRDKTTKSKQKMKSDMSF